MTLIVNIVVAIIAAALTNAILNAWRRRRQNRLNGPSTCGCGHNMAFHDLADGACHYQVSIANTWDSRGHPIAYTRQDCRCRQYVSSIDNHTKASIDD